MASFLTQHYCQPRTANFGGSQDAKVFLPLPTNNVHSSSLLLQMYAGLPLDLTSAKREILQNRATAFYESVSASNRPGPSPEHPMNIPVLSCNLNTLLAINSVIRPPPMLHHLPPIVPGVVFQQDLLSRRLRDEQLSSAGNANGIFLVQGEHGGIFLNRFENNQTEFPVLLTGKSNGDGDSSENRASFVCADYATNYKIFEHRSALRPQPATVMATEAV